MKDDVIRTTRKRVENQAFRDGLLEGVLDDVGRKIREAFKVVGREAQTLSDVAQGAGEIMALSLAELEARRRVEAALQWKALISIIKHLPEDARREVEHELRTVNLDQLDP